MRPIARSSYDIRNIDKTYALHQPTRVVYEEFKENCDQIGVKYGTQIEILMRDFNQIMKIQYGAEVMQNVNAMWDEIMELETKIDEDHGAIPRSEVRTNANHYVDIAVYQEFKDNCDRMGITYGLQTEILMRDFNQVMSLKCGSNAIQKVSAMLNRVRQLETNLEGEAGHTLPREA